MLDTLAVCPPLSIVEQSRLKELKAKDRARVKPEEVKAREKCVTEKTKKLRVARTGMSEKAARQIVIRQYEGILRPDVVLPWDDEELAGCTVADVLADPAQFAGETLADPLEGVDYGRCVAKVMLRDDGTPWIHSFAHGRTIYALKYDAAAVRKAMEAAAKEEVVKIFTSLAVIADLDAIETEELRQLAHEALRRRPARDQRRAEGGATAARQLERQRPRAPIRPRLRDDPRPQIPAPFETDPWLPEMDVLNEVIGEVDAIMPPVRDIDYDTTRVRKLGRPQHARFHRRQRTRRRTTNDATATTQAMDVHARHTTGKRRTPDRRLRRGRISDQALQQSGAASGHARFHRRQRTRRRRRPMTRLPTAQALGAFDDERDGNGGDDREAHRALRRGQGRQSLPGALPDQFRAALHEARTTTRCRSWSRSRTMPIVLGYGEMLAPEGFDRLRGIQFIIQDELRAILPKR